MPFTIKKIAMRLRNNSEYIPLPGVHGEDGEDGVSPAVSFTTITGGHTMTVTDKDHPSGQSINIMDGSSSSLTILSYGHSTWADFIAAYNSRSIVYCRASSDSDPASGSQTRMAFMAYVNSAASPTSVEFQYYRSVSTHSDSQQGDQVYIYKLTSGGTWTVTVREAYTKIAAGTNMSSSYANGTLTLSPDLTGYRTASAQDAIDATEVIVVNIASYSGSQVRVPASGTNAAITADHVLLYATLGTPTNQTGNWTVTTYNGYLTLSGSASAATTVKLVLGKAGTTI